PEFAHVIVARSVPLFQRDHDVRITGAHRPVVEIAGADAGIGQADVVEEARKVTGWNFRANGLLHAIHQARGLLDAGAAPGPEMQAQLAGVDVREKILAEIRQQPHRATAKREEKKSERRPLPQYRMQQGAISLAEFLKRALEEILQ